MTIDDLIAFYTQRRNEVVADGGNWTSGGQYIGEVILMDIDDLDTVLETLANYKEQVSNQYKAIALLERDLYGDTAW